MGAVETESIISFDANVNPIAMASTFTAGGESAVVSGWGGEFSTRVFSTNIY